MIQIIATEKENHLYLVKTSEQINGKLLERDDVTYAEAARLHYFWTRLFIITKVTAFLKQRRKAFELAKAWNLQDQANTLLDSLAGRNYASLNVICKVIVSMENQIRFIAPSETSRHYHFYNTTIRSILQYCNKHRRDVQ